MAQKLTNEEGNVGEKQVRRVTYLVLVCSQFHKVKDGATDARNQTNVVAPGNSHHREGLATARLPVSKHRDVVAEECVLQGVKTDGLKNLLLALRRQATYGAGGDEARWEL